MRHRGFVVASDSAGLRDSETLGTLIRLLGTYNIEQRIRA